MTYGKRFVDNRLTSKFNFERREDRDHIQFRILINGMTVRTKLSHGKPNDISSWLEKEISKQLKVDKNYFHGMMDCPISQEQYYAHLRTCSDELISQKSEKANEQQPTPPVKSETKRNKRNKQRRR
jgi:hypothetical protein